jgi:hypothetical protein
MWGPTHVRAALRHLPWVDARTALKLIQWVKIAASVSVKYLKGFNLSIKHPMDLEKYTDNNTFTTQKFKSDFVDFHRLGKRTIDFNYTSVVHGLRDFIGRGSLNHLKWVNMEHRLYAHQQCVLHLYTDMERQTIVFRCPLFTYLNHEVEIYPTELQRTAHKIQNALCSFLEGMWEYQNQETKRFPAKETSCIHQAGWVSESNVRMW